MTTTLNPHGHDHHEGRGLPSLPRVVVWVGAALREARDVVPLLELIADSRIATPGTLSRRAMLDTFA